MCARKQKITHHSWCAPSSVQTQEFKRVECTSFRYVKKDSQRGYKMYKKNADTVAGQRLLTPQILGDCVSEQNHLLGTSVIAVIVFGAFFF